MNLQKFKEKRGITLIALVVTIIVLLILAGISIQMLTGNSGILTQTQNAKDSTRGGDVQEQVNLAVSENAIAEYTSGTKKTRDGVIGELYRDKKITENEYNKLMGLEGEEQVNVLTIGNVTIDFSVLGSINGLTIGSVYDDSMIGKKINYSSNGQSNWIIFGKDEKGNVYGLSNGGDCIFLTTLDKKRNVENRLYDFIEPILWDKADIYAIYLSSHDEIGYEKKYFDIKKLLQKSIKEVTDLGLSKNIKIEFNENII